MSARCKDDLVTDLENGWLVDLEEDFVPTVRLVKICFLTSESDAGTGLE
jgi:hypothetical protein